MKRLLLLSEVLMIVSAAGFAEDAPRRVSHTAAVQSATAKAMPDYSPIAGIARNSVEK